jgi:hypothetical protein
VRVVRDGPGKLKTGSFQSRVTPTSVTSSTPLVISTVPTNRSATLSGEGRRVAKIIQAAVYAFSY